MFECPSPGGPRETRQPRGWGLQSGVASCCRRRALERTLTPLAERRLQPRPARRWPLAQV
eukprot:10083526-Alexandrium_andersonii.AAC.1